MFECLAARKSERGGGGCLKGKYRKWVNVCLDADTAYTYSMLIWMIGKGRRWHVSEITAINIFEHKLSNQLVEAIW